MIVPSSGRIGESWRVPRMRNEALLGAVFTLLGALLGAAGATLALARDGTGGDPAAAGDLGRPAGAPIELAPACELVRYAGPQTALYSDRPYRTQAAVAALAGHAFCRSPRHGHAAWLLEVLRPTTLLTLASERHGLARSGWSRLPAPVRVEAAGLALDGLWAQRVEPGRYAIEYGHARTANPIFWNPAEARMLLPEATVRGD
jgi:hypothetical protein